MIYPTATLELALDDPPSAAYYDMTLGLAPVAYYRLNQSAGTTGANVVLDSSGNGLHMNAAHGVGFGAGVPGALSGDPDTAASMGGTTTIHRATAVCGAAASFSFEMWFKRSSTGAAPLMYVGPSASSGTVAYLKFDSSDRIIFTQAGAGTPALVTGPAVVDTNWHHVAYVALASSLYLDGVLVGTGADAAAVSASPTPIDTCIGCAFGDPASVVFSGLIDEAAFYVHNLTAGQIATHYLSAATPITATYETDATAYFMGGQQQRGRTYELDTVQAGTASQTLDNRDRRFDPLNTDGAYYGTLKAMRRLRLSWTINAVTYERFVGYVRGWPQSRVGPNMATVQLSLVDGFEQLATADIGGIDIPAGTAGAVIGYALDRAFWPGDLRDLDTGTSIVPTRVATPTQFLSALSYIQQVADGDLGAFFISADGDATFHDRYHRSTATSSATFGDADSGETLTYTDIVVDPESVENVLNDVTSTIDGGTAQHWDDGASISDYFLRSQQRTPLTDTDADALIQSKLIIATHATPALRVNQVTIVPGENLGLWAQVLGREIGDLITVEINPVGVGLPAGGDPISVDCFIEAMSDSYPQQGSWTTTWQLSPSSASVSSWILDDTYWSELDLTTVLG